MTIAPSTASKETKEALKNVKRRMKLDAVMDGFSNAITGTGDRNAKVSAGRYIDEDLLDMQTLEALFKDNDLAYKIVAKPVEDALRAGFGLKRRDSSPEDDAEDAAAIKAEYERLMFVGDDETELDGNEDDKFTRGAMWGRLFGGGGLILGIEGAGGLATPLKLDRVKNIKFVVDFDRQDMSVKTWYPDGRPELYTWHRPGYGDVRPRTADVHESRLVRFPGAMTTNRTRLRNRSWDCSVLQRVYQVLRSFDSMFASVDSMFADASQAVFKLQGLIEALAENDGTATQDTATRLQLMDILRSSAKAIVLEAGGKDGEGAEDFGVVERAFSGIEPVMGQYLIRLASAAGMPLTVLLGMSPAGMDATGESDMILYYNFVDVYRLKGLQPRLLKIIRIIHVALGLEGEPSDWEIVWPELVRPKPLDVATAEKMKIDMLVALITSQVIVPEEAAISLSHAAPSLGLVIDLEARQKALKEALTEVGNRMMEGPQKPEPPKPVAGGGPAAKASERKTPSKAAKRQV